MKNNTDFEILIYIICCTLGKAAVEFMIIWRTEYATSFVVKDNGSIVNWKIRYIFYARSIRISYCI